MGLSKQAMFGKYLILIGIFWAIATLLPVLSLFSSPGGFFGHLRFGPGPLMMLPILPALILAIMAFMKARNNDYKDAGKFGYVGGMLIPALFFISWVPMIIIVPIVYLFWGIALDLITSPSFPYEILFIVLICIILFGWFSYNKKQEEKSRQLGLLLISAGFLSGFYLVSGGWFALGFDLDTLSFLLTFLNLPLIAGGILTLISPEALKK